MARIAAAVYFVCGRGSRSIGAGGALPDEVICSQHGRQGVGLVCTHIAHAVDSGKQVGFFWGDDTDTARPDAWCQACEEALLAVPKGQPTDKWFLSCDYKIFCAQCWDDAKSALSDQRRARSGE